MKGLSTYTRTHSTPWMILVNLLCPAHCLQWARTFVDADKIGFVVSGAERRTQETVTVKSVRVKEHLEANFDTVVNFNQLTWSRRKAVRSGYQWSIKLFIGIYQKGKGSWGQSCNEWESKIFYTPLSFEEIVQLKQLKRFNASGEYVSSACPLRCTKVSVRGTYLVHIIVR